ncbi:MAG: DUF192 domain-containing protein [Thermaerobacterales bacterium]
MAPLRVINLTRGHVLAERATEAATFGRRLAGLLGRSSLAPGEALVITPCNAVHTLGMRFAIDIVFLDQDGLVLKTAANAPPWRFGPTARGAVQAIELPAGRLAATGTRPGDLITLER